MKMNWTKVEDALPESGVPVIIASYNRVGRPLCLRAEYAAPMTLPVGLDCDVDGADYDESGDEYYCPEGWYESSEYNEYDEVLWRVEGTITHWMPLPASPAMYNSIKPVR
jgi:hypothetical protein